ncbi:PREDICTED: leucine-rich repeat-containing G-protein coupled receptor 5-like [Papilio xuthus]|uniref:Leucine-rich repeat-containing G-protein coupled receptor 5-like n=1 Tax=Papilio xuthus TaxID=66420 RepID=A0AAJ6ZJN6_PAPXU|nr:PREDICTED: leucine-rich repeat-containing G-protein coupled receptor 5-like [Papilio xuthus]
MNIKIAPMARNIVYWLLVVLSLEAVDAKRATCLGYPNCICGGTLALEVDCIVSGQTVKIDVLPGVYVNIKCENSTFLNYNNLPNFNNRRNIFKTVSFKNCPLPSTSFKEVLTNIGVNKTMSLIYQNEKNITQNFDRNHFVGLEDLTKLLISVNGVIFLPDNLFMDLNNLKWLNLRIKSVNISKEIFKPLPRLDTLEINHNRMTNMPNNIFEYLIGLKKFSLWQSNISIIPNDIFEGVRELEELDMSSNDLRILPSVTFYPLKNLKKLTLFSNKFSVLPDNLFAQNKLLSTLIILNNDVKIKELPKNLLRNLQYLKQVHIQRCGIEIIYTNLFTNSSRINNISLAHNEIKILPEAVFNDQINLLELDISYNNLESLGIKLFSSLVRLERLNLCCNSITEISGLTFLPLISLTYLNMERNNLKVISSNLFENNRQRLSIFFAYNELDFENKILVNNSWIIRRNSPFINTHNLQMLNLSHNKFRDVSIDWWVNGHEHIDLRFNFIKNLWGDGEHEFAHNYKIIKTPIKEIWIGNNNLSCGCHNLWFLDYIQAHWKTKISDIDFKHCPMWSTRVVCYIAFYVIISITGILFFIAAFIIIVYFIIALKYSIADEEFVLKEIVPGLQDIKNVKLLMKPISDLNTKKSFMKILKRNESEKYVTIVIFSPNYLMTTYSKVNIKKIRGEMLKARNTIYIFVDTGPDNSIYAFLKDQRETRISVLWNELYFWDKIIDFVSKYSKHRKFGYKTRSCQGKNNLVKEINKVKRKYTPKMSFMKLSEWPQTDTFETFAHSQV